MKTIVRKIVFLLMIVLLFTPSCTPTPTTNVTCSVAALIKAIDTANADVTVDILELDPGCSYTLTDVNTTVTSTFDGSTFQYGDVGLPPIITPITINGYKATISRAESAPDFRIFHVTATGILTLNDLTIANGSANGPGSAFPSSGGAIYNSGVLAVNRSILQSNKASYYGGAIYDAGVAATYIKNSTIRDNAAPIGGAIFEGGAPLTVEGSSIINNDATTEGGGINVAYGSELTIRKSEISFNHSARRGGGIFKDAGSDRFPTTISDSTFEGNTADWGGGAIFVWRTPLTISDSTFRQNQAGEYGGALGYQNDGTESVNIRNVTFDGNTTELDGGAIHFSGEMMDIIGTTFRKNAAQNGGAIHNAAAALDRYIIRADTKMQISRSTLENNTAKVDGGGIFNGGTLAMKLCSLIGNRATSLGGGMHNLGMTVIQDSTFNDNKAGTDGGGLNTYGTDLVTGSTFTHNSSRRGGGIASAGGTTLLGNDTFSENAASESGGGIFSMGPAGGGKPKPSGGLAASFVTIAFNRASSGGGIATSGGSLKVKNSIIALSTSGGDCSTSAGGFLALAENINSDGTCPGFTLKADPLLASLADNGGPTWTHALKTDSPALDAAPDCTTILGVAVNVDQRTMSRPGGSLCDLGAYERVKEKNSLTPTLVGITITPTLIDITITPTLIQPNVTAIQNANCRYGPGTAYDIADTLFTDQTAPIVGRNELNTWWQIKGPTFGSLCWVSKVTVEVNGSTDGVPVRVAPPPPTLTPEPRPQKPKGCYVYDASRKVVCTVPCPPNARPGGTCKP